MFNKLFEIGVMLVVCSSMSAWNKMWIEKTNSSLQTLTDSLSPIVSWSFSLAASEKPTQKQRGCSSLWCDYQSMWCLSQKWWPSSPFSTSGIESFKVSFITGTGGRDCAGQEGPASLQGQRAGRTAAGKARMAIKQWWAALLAYTPTPLGIK